jgi:LacI family transcriptional regulator
MRTGARINMQQVAERAGVAASSVSRVLSGHPNVSELMRHRVLDAVAALGYEPDLLAQSLRRGATMTVGFVVGDISNPLLSEIALGAETGLRDAGYSMLLANSMDEPALDATHIKLFAQRRVDGLLLSISDETAAATIAALDRAAAPVVLVDRELHLASPAAAVLADHATGIYRAVDHLVALGHVRIAIIVGNLKVRPSRERAAALRRRCRQLGVTGAVRSGSFTPEHGDTAMTALLESADRPTAVIAGSNQILVGVLAALQRAGCALPGDLSLVTCDEVPLAQFLVPPLSTIERDRHEMGALAASLLLELLRGGEARRAVVPTRFCPTSSCGPPPGAPRRHGRRP